MKKLIFNYRWMAFTLCVFSFIFLLNGPATAEEEPLSPDMLAIQGRWIRTDFPYIIQIRHSRDGSIQAEYFNPRSIHVEKTETAVKDGRLHVLVELQDVNYPGSTYVLAYDRSQDILEGIYYQAVQKQSFPVSFVRQSEKQ